MRSEASAYVSVWRTRRNGSRGARWQTARNNSSERTVVRITAWLLQATNQEPVDVTIEQVIEQIQNPLWRDLLLLFGSAIIAAAVGALLAGFFSNKAAEQTINAATTQEYAERMWSRSRTFGAVLTELRMNANLMSDGKNVQHAYLMFETGALEAAYGHLGDVDETYRVPLQKAHAKLRRYNTLAEYANRQGGFRYSGDLHDLVDEALQAIGTAELPTTELAHLHSVAASKLESFLTTTKTRRWQVPWAKDRSQQDASK